MTQHTDPLFLNAVPPTLLYPAASQMMMASKVARATPPSVPRAGLGRT